MVASGTSDSHYLIELLHRRSHREKSYYDQTTAAAAQGHAATSHGHDRSFMLAACFDLLDYSPSAARLKAEAAQDGWTVLLDDTGGADYHLDFAAAKIHLNHHGLSVRALGRSGFFLNGLLFSMLRALREIWQDKRHRGFEDYAPDSVLLLERVRAADQLAVSIMAAWDMLQADRPALWRHILGSADGDLALEFLTQTERAGAEACKRSAAAAALIRWWSSEDRVAACDHATLEKLDEQMNIYGAQSFGARKADRMAVEVLSCLPDRTAYLQGKGDMILRDPRFSGLNDPINQSHFLQIMRDRQVTYVKNVPFRSPALASLFAQGEAE